MWELSISLTLLTECRVDGITKKMPGPGAEWMAYWPWHLNAKYKLPSPL